jgi:hypothetical protein
MVCAAVLPVFRLLHQPCRNRILVYVLKHSLKVLLILLFRANKTGPPEMTGLMVLLIPPYGKNHLDPFQYIRETLPFFRR